MQVQYIGGFKSGEVTHHQGDAVYAMETPLRDASDPNEKPELPKQVKYRLMRIPSETLSIELFYVHESFDDETAKAWVKRISDMC